jgi:hypothetical protein
MMATAMIDQCVNLPFVGIFFSCSSSSYFATTAATHHSPIMLLLGQCSKMTNLAWRLYGANGSNADNMLEGYHQLPGTKPHVIIHRSQPKTNPQCPSMHWEPKWPTGATMVPHSQRRCRQQQPRMLADCCMWLHQDTLIDKDILVTCHPPFFSQMGSKNHLISHPRRTVVSCPKKINCIDTKNAV